jgi:hypothetical protein
MNRRAPRAIAPLVLVLGLLVAVPTPAVVAEQACHPILTPPAFSDTTPTPEDVLGFAIGSQQVTTAESDRYLRAVADASDRVVDGVAATSVQGRALRYAVVGSPANLGRLPEIRADLARLRDPATSATQAAAIAARTPAILWIAGNVHGNEESGADATLRILYEIADRTDCVARRILDDALVVLLPIQNPDGREANTRRNAYGFDMNRDWFARTQPETDGRLELIRSFPPQLFLDAHEFGFKTYFFPPNADPVYAETGDLQKIWIDDVFSAAISAEFDRQKIAYFHGAPYDLFAPIFGDTVPTVGFGAAGMTLEKHNGDSISVRSYQQYVASWVSLYEGAVQHERLLGEWHGSFSQAYRDGVAGRLEPNAVFNKGSSLYQQVPDRRVRHYFLRPSAERGFELDTLVRRLQRMDVKVYRLNAALDVPDYRPYGRAPSASRLPAGTIWVPMAQSQKRWVQAMLNEDSFIPVTVTYDVTAWSNPLLLNLDGGSSGASLSPSATLIPPVAGPKAPTLPKNPPSIGLWEIPGSTAAFQSAGSVRYLFERVWDLPYSSVTADDIRAGLPGIDVLLVPDGYTNYGLQALGSKGKRALRTWVNDGGRFVGWQGGAALAARSGVSTAVLNASHTNAPGSLIRVALDPGSPLAAGVGPFAWVMYDDDDVMTQGVGGATTPVRYPNASSGDRFVSGLSIGTDELDGTAAVLDETVGAGRAIVFSFDPNFRAWTLGTQRILRNALLGPDPAGPASAAAAGSTARSTAERRAVAAATALPQVASPLRLRISGGDLAAATDVIGRLGLSATVLPDGTDALILISNPKAYGVEDHPKLQALLQGLRASGVTIGSLSVP